jgi:hypothetical protein
LLYPKIPKIILNIEKKPSSRVPIIPPEQEDALGFQVVSQQTPFPSKQNFPQTVPAQTHSWFWGTKPTSQSTGTHFEEKHFSSLKQVEELIQATDVSNTHSPPSQTYPEIQSES